MVVGIGVSEGVTKKGRKACEWGVKRVLQQGKISVLKIFVREGVSQGGKACQRGVRSDVRRGGVIRNDKVLIYS